MMSKPIPKGEIIESNFFKYVDKRFLSSEELINKGQVEVTIDRVEYHKELVFENGRTKKDAKLMYFKETPKPIMLNKRKWDTLIAEFASIDPKDWAGGKIKLNAGMTKFAGKDVFCIIINDKDPDKSANQIVDYFEKLKKAKGK